MYDTQMLVLSQVRRYTWVKMTSQGDIVFA